MQIYTIAYSILLLVYAFSIRKSQLNSSKVSGKKPGQVGVHQGTEARVKNGKEINWKHPTTLKETPLA
jgi:hypothetical protein